MTDEFLSQEEIDALLRGDNAPATQGADAAAEQPVLDELEQDALGEMGNISMGSAATTLSILLGHRVSITTPRVEITTLAAVKKQYPLPYLVIEVGYTQGLNGTNLFCIKEHDAAIIADLMMGGDGSNPPAELNELHMSAVTEAMNQMMGSTATSLSTVFKKRVDIAPPVVNMVDFATDATTQAMPAADEQVVRVSFRMEVESLIDSEIMQLIPVAMAKEMVANIMQKMQEDAAAAAPAPAAATASAGVPPAGPAVMPAAPPAAAAAPNAVGSRQGPAPAPREQPVAVQPVQFAQLQSAPAATGGSNIDLIMDVPLQVTVELGRTRKQIREVLDLSPGSVIELDKLAGEPVDILVNGKLIAKGEVVVIDENFGVRVTDIVSPMERVNNIQ